MKRGMLEVQFNWIFILIAGAVILAFFFSIIQKQQSISEQKLALEVVNQIDAITTGAAVARGAAQRVDLPRSGIDFTCTDDCSCAFSVGPVTRDYQDKIIFSPQHIEGKEIVFWTQEWRVPFRVTNFLYITNDRIKYFFVYDENIPQSEQLKRQLEQELPAQINAEFITPSEICTGDTGCVKNENFLQVKFVFLETLPDILSGSLGLLHDSFRTTDVTGLYVSSGQLTFFKCRKNRVGNCDSTPSLYVGDAPLYGAIFAYDETAYRCNLREATKRLSYVSHVLELRNNILFQDSELALRGCDYSIDTLGRLHATADSQVTAFTNALPTMAVDAAALEQENEALLLRSCPTIY